MYNNLSSLNKGADEMENKKITMQYPYDSSNLDLDGQVHEIIPYEMRPVYINGQIMFVLY